MEGTPHATLRAAEARFGQGAYAESTALAGEALALLGDRLELRTAVHRAVSTGQEIRRENIKVKFGRETQQIDLVVRPLPELGKDPELYIVLFRELFRSSGSSQPAAENYNSIEHPVIK